MTLAAPLPNTSRGVSTRLSVDRKGEKLIYGSGRSVFVRDIADLSVAKQYTGHTLPVNVAKISPSGYYVCSGDSGGNVRIWDCVGDDQTLKNESRPISDIRDVEWDGESQRIIAVGNGKERFGHAFTADTANSVGEVTGHSQIINAVAIRQQRPFRAATAGDDGVVIFLHGTPYKYNKTLRSHTGFVYDVRFSPDGTHLVSCGADGKIILYDGKTGDLVGEFDDAKAGSVFSLAWQGDSKHLASASADGAVRLWDVSTKSCMNTWQVAQGVSGQQVGVVFAGEKIISLALSGELAILSNDGAIQRIHGHQRGITALARTPEGLITGSFDRQCLWNANLVATPLEGHTAQVTAIVSTDTFTCSIGYDDTLRIFTSGKYTKSISLPSQPRGVGAGGDKIAVALSDALQLYSKDGEKQKSTGLAFDATAAAVSKDASLIAVGGEGTVEILSQDLASLRKLSSSRTTVTALAFSPSGDHLAVGESSGKIVLYSTADGSVVTSRWAFHVGRITQLTWNASGERVASTSLDTHIYVWSVAKPGSKVEFKNAHQGGATGVVWEGEDGLITSGADGTLKKWKL
ncbi:WD40 repeat-like protein [Savitreella phatthalungensis]